MLIGAKSEFLRISKLRTGTNLEMQLDAIACPFPQVRLQSGSGIACEQRATKQNRDPDH
jgi:hypothetical protein